LKKLTEETKRDIKLLSLGSLSIFKDNKADFRQVREHVKREHNISESTIERELKKIKRRER